MLSSSNPTSSSSAPATDPMAGDVPDAQKHLYTPEEHAVGPSAPPSPSSPTFASSTAKPANTAASKPATQTSASGGGSLMSGVTRTVLIPVDRSPHSNATVKWAKSNFLRPSDHIVLIHVRPFQPLYMTDLGGEFLGTVNAMENAARDQSHELIRAFGRYLMSTQAKHEGDEHAPLRHVRGFAIRGDARADILRKAKELQADAIVMGSRGLGSIKRVFLGSVSDYISHNAPCPVIIVRERDEHDPAIKASPSVVAGSSSSTSDMPPTPSHTTPASPTAPEDASKTAAAAAAAAAAGQHAAHKAPADVSMGA